MDLKQLTMASQLSGPLGNGNLAVCIVASLGPHAGIPIIALVSRKEVVNLIHETKRMGTQQRLQVAQSALASMRAVLMDAANPVTNADFMADMPIMFCMRLLIK